MLLEHGDLLDRLLESLVAEEAVFFLLELVAELLVRTYFESQGKTPYVVRRTWNCHDRERNGKDGSGR